MLKQGVESRASAMSIVSVVWGMSEMIFLQNILSMLNKFGKVKDIPSTIGIAPLAGMVTAVKIVFERAVLSSEAQDWLLFI